MSDKCKACKGEGYIIDDPNDYAENCPECNGTGKETESKEEGNP